MSVHGRHKIPVDFLDRRNYLYPDINLIGFCPNLKSAIIGLNWIIAWKMLQSINILRPEKNYSFCIFECIFLNENQDFLEWKSGYFDPNFLMSVTKEFNVQYQWVSARKT